jgi:hypothetical protein
MYDDTKEYFSYLLDKKILISTEELNYHRLNEVVINKNLNFKEHNQNFKKYGICVIDDFLKPEYCERLRRFMLTINFRNDIYKSYASVNFSKKYHIWFRLLTNISEEIKENFEFLKNLQYSRGWSFIHDNVSDSSVNKHHDSGSLITFNIWCTPNKCILDNSPNYNGVVIYDSFDKDNISNVSKNIISYKFNRMVVFDSRKIHESLPPRFKDGYENRKINYTFLYN